MLIPPKKISLKDRLAEANINLLFQELYTKVGKASVDVKAAAASIPVVLQGTIDPTPDAGNVQPASIGQEYINLTARTWWKSVSLDQGDWVMINTGLVP
jgi:hypothetical protein